MTANINSFSFNDEFNLEIQKKFLMLLIFDSKWAALSGLDIIQPEFFENRILHNICFWIHAYYKKYKCIPTKLVLTEQVRDFINNQNLSTKEYYQYTEVLDEIFTLNDNENLEYFKEKVISFVRQIAWKKVLLKGSDTLKIGNYEDAINEFKKVLSLGMDNDLGLDFSNLTSENFIDSLKEDYDKSNMLKTGIDGWDKALGGGFVKKNVHLLGAPPGGGKACAVNTPVLTPNGWKKAGEIKIGDKLIGRDGKSTKVLAVYPQGTINNYKIIFSDHSETNCCINHLWSVIDTEEPDETFKTLSLGQILEKGLYKDNTTARWYIPLVDPVEFETKVQPIPAYIMGILLGNEDTITSTSHLDNLSLDPFIKEKIKNELSNNIRLDLNSILQDLNLFNKKLNERFIPDLYKFGSIEQRIALLNGLMDLNGSNNKRNKISYTTASKQLAEDIVELVQSLGGMAYFNSKLSKHKGIYYNVIITLNKINPFTLPKKAQSWKKTDCKRYITKVIKQKDVESVCFKVDNPEELFVIEHYIVTHNSRIMAFLAKQALMQLKRVIFITLELSEVETQANINSAITSLTMHEMMKPENRIEFEKKLMTFKNTFNPQCIVKFYKPGAVTADTLHNFIQKVIQKKEEELGSTWKPDVIFIDYLDKLLPTQKIKGNMYEDVGGVATDLKNLGITFDCPVISGSQLGRYTWVLSGDAVVSMDSIAESAQKVHICHSLTTINSNSVEKQQNKTRLYLAKSRSGIPGSIVWCLNNLGKCELKEIPPWDPKTLMDTATYTIKDTQTKH